MQATPAPSAELFAAPQPNTGNPAQGTTTESGESFSSHLASETVTQTAQAGQLHPRGKGPGIQQKEPKIDSLQGSQNGAEELGVELGVEANIVVPAVIDQTIAQIDQAITQPVNFPMQQQEPVQTKQVENLLTSLMQGSSEQVPIDTVLQRNGNTQAALQPVVVEEPAGVNQQPLLAANMSPGNQQGLTQEQLQWVIDNTRGLQQNNINTQVAPQQAQGISTEAILPGANPTPANPAALNQLQGTNGETPVIVQQWSANYSPVQASQAATTEETVAPQNQGQVITVYQTGKAEEFTLRAAPVSQNTTQQQSGQRLDATGNYIQSHMPTNSVQNAFGSQTEQPFGEENGQTGQNTNPGNLQAEQLKTGELQAGKEAPQVLFATEAQQATSATQATQTTAPGSLFIKLASGFTVPEGAVMDQVINHFSSNLKLESGSVSLKLYPRELGQLQMEIEVKNDNIKAHITAQNPQAQEALDRHLPRLKEALAQQGFDLSQVEITVAASDKYDGQAFQENLEQHQLAQSFKSGTTNSYTSTEGDETEESLVEEQQSLSVTA